MRNVIGTIALCLAVGGCVGSSGEEPTTVEPSAEQVARNDYARIGTEANVFVYSDILGYRAGETTPHRVTTACEGDTCTIGFVRSVNPSEDASVENVSLETLLRPQRVRRVTERLSSDAVDVHALGGWMTHSLFASQADLLKSGPELGTTRAHAYVFGNATGENPTVEGTATWRGFAVGRDVSVTDDLEAVVQGDMRLTIGLAQAGLEGTPADALLADIALTSLASSGGQSYDDIEWDDVVIVAGAFARHAAPDNSLAGRFFGLVQQEVAAIFEREGISGAFGGERQ